MLTLKYIIKSALFGRERVPWDNERVPDSHFYKDSFCRDGFDKKKVNVSESLEQIRKQARSENKPVRVVGSDVYVDFHSPTL